jgi:hypothetical protein
MIWGVGQHLWGKHLRPEERRPYRSIVNLTTSIGELNERRVVFIANGTGLNRLWRERGGISRDDVADRREINHTHATGDGVVHEFQDFSALGASSCRTLRQEAHLGGEVKPDLLRISLIRGVSGDPPIIDVSG